MTTSPDLHSCPPGHLDDDGGDEDREGVVMVTSVDLAGTYRSARSVIDIPEGRDAEDPDAFARELLAAAQGLAAMRGPAYSWALAQVIQGAGR